MWDLIVVGAGAAGLMAGIRAADRGLKVLLLEKNRKPAVKILMSGGTRCNLTQATNSRGIVAAYGPPGKFLHSALAGLSPQDVVEFFHALDVPTKVEPTGKIFPQSDKALDVQQALLKRLRQSTAELLVEQPVVSISREPSRFEIRGTTEVWHSQCLLLTTGGRSYPGCGTTGDGYSWATGLGHTLIPPRPALVPLVSPAPWVRDLKGVTLPDVSLRAQLPDGSLVPGVHRGSLLFTHFGLSGPVVLNVSRWVSGQPQITHCQIICDLLPDFAEQALVQEWQRLAQTAGQSRVLSWCSEQLPRRLMETLLSVAHIDPGRKFAELSKVERQQLVTVLKRLAVPLSGTMGFEKAEVTAGGIALDEVDSRTMESRLVPGLYFAGEILDLDGPIGGYNFQAAFSTGWLAGSSVLRGTGESAAR